MSAELTPEQIRLTITTWTHLARHTDWVAPRVALALIAERDLLQEKVQHLQAALLEYQQAPAAMEDAQEREEARCSDAGRVEVPDCRNCSHKDTCPKEGYGACVFHEFDHRRLPSPQPSADVVVVPREEWEAYQKWEKTVRGLAFGMSRENECLATLDAIRSAPSVTDDRFASCPRREPCTPAGCAAGGGAWPRCPSAEEIEAHKGGDHA